MRRKIVADTQMKRCQCQQRTPFSDISSFLDNQIFVDYHGL
jgi:hypothetical protein